MTWNIFKKAFLDRYFPRDMREAKVIEFINLRKGGMSVHEFFEIHKVVEICSFFGF